MLEFKPINKTTISNEIVDQVLAMIRSGGLNPGDRLPSERQLGELLRVGRSSIREALKGLETAGLLQRTTEGTILCEPEGMETAALWLRISRTKIHEVFETRKLMEIELAGLAAQRATPEDIKNMIGSVVKTTNAKKAAAADLSFHRCLAEAAKNSVFSRVYNLIAELLFQTHRYYSRLGHSRGLDHFVKSTLSQHKAIIKAIQAHDANAAKEATRVHLEYAEKELLSQINLNP
jgi:GntR family transcriptional regulator, transcriptional repressor for pyruvate dehydrogenase complex